MPCSIERTPARTALLIPSVDWACDITQSPAARASETIASISSTSKPGCCGLSVGDRTPPDVAILITSAPARTSSRTFRRISSGPSTIEVGTPGYAGKISACAPEGSQPSPCPPVWLSIVIEIWTRGPRTIPSSSARLTPRSAPPASRTVVMPMRRVESRFRIAS